MRTSPLCPDDSIRIWVRNGESQKIPLFALWSKSLMLLQPQTVNEGSSATHEEWTIPGQAISQRHLTLWQGASFDLCARGHGNRLLRFKSACAILCFMIIYEVKMVRRCLREITTRRSPVGSPRSDRRQSVRVEAWLTRSGVSLFQLSSANRVR